VGRFAGRVVLVTGASSGIGAALAREFARQGADLVLAARRLPRLEDLASELRGMGRRAVALRCDVTEDGGIEQAVARGLEALGRLDVVVANAGFVVGGPVERLTLEDYRRQFETNVYGVLRTARAALPALRSSHGVLVIVGSVSGHVSTPGGSPYAMSKAAVRALAGSLRGEVAADGVGVVLVSPGFVESEIRQVDNRGVYRPHVRDPVPRWLVVPADRAARAIVRAVFHRRREAIITGHGKVVVWLARLFPSVLAFLVERGGYGPRRAPATSRR
jgi:NAD(P)-dependent dehydrogenase (short-subunit alcohol dehydrogenase family)